jgi:hypothetical protein
LQSPRAGKGKERLLAGRKSAILSPRGRAVLIHYCNEKSTTTIVNANKVNGESSYFSHTTFYVIFCDSGRFLDSRIPVKYSRNLEVNGETAHSAMPRAMTLWEISFNINTIAAG